MGRGDCLYKNEPQSGERINPLLTKQGWRNGASPIGRSLKRRHAGVVAYTESWRVSDHPI